MLSFIFCSVIGLACCCRPTGESVPSFGTGPYEVIIFSDYFCHECQSLETDLDPMLNALMQKHTAKIIFIDAPVNELTQIYDRYFLYAVQANHDFFNAMKVRKTLFSIAEAGGIASESKLAAEFKARGIAFKTFDQTSVLIRMNDLMKIHDIRSTPICIIKYSASDIRKFQGPDEIAAGLAELLSAHK